MSKDDQALLERLNTILDDYDRDAADAALDGELWPHDPSTEVDVPVGLLRQLARALAQKE